VVWDHEVAGSNPVTPTFFREKPLGHHAEEIFCFNSSIPASSPGVAPSSKSCRLGQGILRPTQLLAAVGRLSVQTVIDCPAAYYQRNQVGELQVIRHVRQVRASAVKRGKEEYGA
jgi:hypothetical protein